MEPESQNIPLLRTKLYRPPIPVDHVPRLELLERLDKYPDRPLILVSAPAGYGKSTLVSSWLESCGRPGGWLSLDRDDNDLQQFLSYFIAAVQVVFPSAACDTQSLVDTPNLPPLEVLADTLVNELDGVGQEFILVLDDIHHIREKAVHEFFNKILLHPPRCMQLVLAGRRDPVISITSLRARGMLTELRMQDLRFTADESTKFLHVATSCKFEESNFLELAEKTEGWVTGLRLAALAMRGQGMPIREILKLKGTTRYIFDYLVSEVLDRQPAGIRQLLLFTSILPRFCAPLCDALSESDETQGQEAIPGHTFIKWLQEQNLFIIPMDMENRWFRYHHLFQDLLKIQLNRRAKRRNIAEFYSRASAWCKDHALIEDAIHYALAAGDNEGAADIVEQQRDAEFDANRWNNVGRWLDRLPDKIKQHRPALLLAEARVLNEKYRLADIPSLVERSRILLTDQPHKTLLQAELSYFLGFVSFWKGEGMDAQAHFNRAMELLPESSESHLRAQVQLYTGITTHINGQTDAAIQMLSSWITGQHLRTGMVWERLIFGLTAVHLLSNNLAPVHHNSRLLLEDAARNDQVFIKTWGDLFLGIVALQRLELTEALQHFDLVIKNKYDANHRAAIDSMIGTAVAAELLGQSDNADQSLSLAQDYARWTADPSNLDIVYSCEARIALLRGDLDRAVMWQKGFNSPPYVPGMLFWFANPLVTECRVLAAAGTKAGMAEAVVKLAHLRQATEFLHYDCQTIEIMVLQALVAHLQGRRNEAFDSLKHAIVLAEPGGWIRPFVELGPPMADLLSQLLEQDTSSGHLRKILRAFRGPQSVSNLPQPLVEPLTHRELDVLELLSERLRNKEIAEKLSISPKTVKAHLSAIYQKLQVAKRREAVETAARLGILS